MPPVIRVPRQLILLPLPVTAGQKQLKLAYLTAKLVQYSLDQIAEQELDKIYAWPLMANSRLKRLYRNYTLVYTRAELKTLLLLSYKDILGPAFFEDPSVPEEVTDEVELLNFWIPAVPLDPADAGHPRDHFTDAVLVGYVEWETAVKEAATKELADRYDRNDYYENMSKDIQAGFFILDEKGKEVWIVPTTVEEKAARQMARDEQEKVEEEYEEWEEKELENELEEILESGVLESGDSDDDGYGDDFDKNDVSS